MDENQAVIEPLITNDATLFGLLAVTLALIFRSEKSENRYLKTFHRYVPTLLVCYFVPSLYNTFGLIDPESSKLYYVASRYLLPACLVLLTISVDLKAVFGLGYRAVVMFLTGTVGIMLGGPIALMIIGAISPETVGGDGPDSVWRGLTTVAGSWIGGGANQAAMKEVFNVGDTLFGQMLAVDIIWANVWMAVLLFMSGSAAQLDAKLGADTSAIERLKAKVEKFQAEHARHTTFHDLMYMCGIAFGITGIAHAAAGVIVPWISENAPALERLSLTSSFFWIVVISTTGGVIASFTRASKLEGAGASRVGSAFLYVLIATIGMKMDLLAIFDNPGLFAVGGVWISFHAILLLTMARLIKAPLFYMAVGSQANVGGAASAPVVAAAFHPALAPVGVLLAVVGYAIGTYAAWICGLIMQAIVTP